MKAYVIAVACILNFMILAPSVFAENTNDNKSAIVKNLANIFVGLNATKEAEVIKKYGDGFFVKDEGHAGGRYFTDRNRTITLHVEIGVDNIIELVELAKGLDLPLGSEPTAEQLISPRLDAEPKIDKGLRLGMAPDDLLKKIGTPDSDKQENSKRIIQYQADSENDPRVLLFYSATFIFEDNHLVKVSLSDGC